MWVATERPTVDKVCRVVLQMVAKHKLVATAHIALVQAVVCVRVHFELGTLGGVPLRTIDSRVPSVNLA